MRLHLYKQKQPFVSYEQWNVRLHAHFKVVYISNCHIVLQHYFSYLYLNSLLRLYLTFKEPSYDIYLIALYIIHVYSIMWFEIKSSTKEMIDKKIIFNNHYIYISILQFDTIYYLFIKYNE